MASSKKNELYDQQYGHGSYSFAVQLYFSISRTTHIQPLLFSLSLFCVSTEFLDIGMRSDQLKVGE